MMGNRAPSGARDTDVRRLYIFGAGGHGREIAWLARQKWGDGIEMRFVVDREEFLSAPVNGIPVELLTDANAGPEARFLVALGDPGARRAATLACLSAGHQPATLVHPRTEVSPWTEVGAGAVIFPGGMLSTNVVIGQHVHVNVGCTVSHDVAIGEYATLSPGVQVAGYVVIGRKAFIGTGATIANGRNQAPLVIGDGAVIAAGACVISAVAPGAMVAGVPAVRKR